MRMGVGRDKDKRLIVGEIDADEEFVFTIENRKNGEILGLQVRDDEVTAMRMRGETLEELRKSLRKGKVLTWDELCQK